MTIEISDTSYPAMYESGLRIATAAHLGQTRADGVTPYIVHPVTVRDRLLRKLSRFKVGESTLPGLPGALWLATGLERWNGEPIALIASCAALCHDVVEDHPEFDLTDAFLQAGFPSEFVRRITRIVVWLSNEGDGDYLDYLLTLAKRIDMWAIMPVIQPSPLASTVEDSLICLLIKQADMEANLLDLDNLPSKGRRKSMHTKYTLAHWILFRTRPDLSPLST